MFECMVLISLEDFSVFALSRVMDVLNTGKEQRIQMIKLSNKDRVLY
jgi:hypothetical protein